MTLDAGRHFSASLELKQVPELPSPASCCLNILTKKQACKISQIKTIANFAGQVDNRVSIKLAIPQATESAVLFWDENETYRMGADSCRRRKGVLRRVKVARRHFSKLRSSWFAYQALHSAEGVDSDDFCQIREPMVNACKYSAIHGKF